MRHDFFDDVFRFTSTNNKVTIRTSLIESTIIEVLKNVASYSLPVVLLKRFSEIMNTINQQFCSVWSSFGKFEVVRAFEVPRIEAK